ncbi:hypothetical protein BHE90_013158 [Fusarium euwallaceae]|uniref:AttH domain-containing protein n=1 Tax=Fusarium euwallaceae TaxID=1147111 RepID=A0A430L9L0_9HYPO|nr:hypothetical protein BHE90_013158 [Fusarium euwallaceae]
MTAPTLSWVPPQYAPTTIENDGTSVFRFDCRKTLSHVTEDINNVNNVYMLYYITTKEGKKFHLNTNAGLNGHELFGTFVSLNDLQTLKAYGASTLVPGKGSKVRLHWESEPQTIIAPEDGDKWTGTRMLLDFAGIKLDASIQPTGGNFYYGGNGGVCIYPAGPDPDPAIAVPGWSWYWANPTTRIAGHLSINGEEHEIDSDASFALFERQWGNFTCRPLYFALWGWLESGEVFIVWGLAPDIEGQFSQAFASFWHPNGLHEMIPVGPESRCSDISVSSATGVKYFNHFFIDLPARNASIKLKKWIRDAELLPEPPLKEYITISESYAEGTVFWNGKEVSFFGHVEQLGGPE